MNFEAREKVGDAASECNWREWFRMLPVLVCADYLGEKAAAELADEASRHRRGDRRRRASRTRPITGHISPASRAEAAHQTIAPAHL